ncbi:MAG: hypothetical protein ACYTF6_13575, partial [Planctomycetota bacterium]
MVDEAANLMIDEAATALAVMAEAREAHAEKDMTLSAYAQRWVRGMDVSATGVGSLGGPSNPFRQSLWTYRCISVIAQNAAGVPLRLSRGEATGTRGIGGLKGVRVGRHSDRVVC